MAISDRRSFLKQVGLSVGVVGTQQLLRVPPSVLAARQAKIGPPPGIFAAGKIIGVGSGVVLLTNRDHLSLPILVTSSTRVWKGGDTTLDKVAVGDYAYCVTAPLPGGKRAGISLWINHVLAATEVVSRSGNTLRVRKWGDPKQEGEVRLTAQTEVWYKGRSGAATLIPGVHARVLGTVLPDQTLLANKVFVGFHP